MMHLPQSLSNVDESSLIQAYQRLEYPSFAARLSSAVGTPIEMGMKLLPRQWCFNMQRCAEKGISKALDVAIANVKQKTGSHSGSPSADWSANTIRL